MSATNYKTERIPVFDSLMTTIKTAHVLNDKKWTLLYNLSKSKGIHPLVFINKKEVDMEQINEEQQEPQLLDKQRTDKRMALMENRRGDRGLRKHEVRECLKMLSYDYKLQTHKKTNLHIHYYQVIRHGKINYHLRYIVNH